MKTVNTAFFNVACGRLPDYMDTSINSVLTERSPTWEDSLQQVLDLSPSRPKLPRLAEGNSSCCPKEERLSGREKDRRFSVKVTSMIYIDRRFLPDAV